MSERNNSGPVCPNCGGNGGGTFALSWGRWGGIYFHRRALATRLCLGWFAVTYLSRDLDCVLQIALEAAPTSEGWAAR